ncbi:MAG: hypothetical protein WA996_02255 [Candidatus Promineifilaceae bacterium]
MSYWIERIQSRKTLAAALFFLLLALIFLNRTLLPPPGEALGGHDLRGYYYPFLDAVREGLRSGGLPFWTPYLFNGLPLLSDPQIGTFYPPAWLTLVLPVNVGFSWYMLFHIWLAGMGMFAFVRIMGGDWLPALLSGIAFAFSGLLAGRLWAGHTIVYAMYAWIPWLLFALIWSVRRCTWWSAVLAGVPLGLAILSGHLPSLLYAGLIWGAFVVYLLWTERERRWLVLRQALLMALVGVALAAVQLVPFLQFSLESQRVAAADYEFATDYSLPPAHLATLLVPEFFGEPTRIGYWSVPTFEELSYYAGLLALLGLVLALRRPTRLTWFYLILIIAGLWLALGRYGGLYKIFYDLFPPFRLVRAPGRAGILYLFAVTAMLGHSLSNWRSVPLEKRKQILSPLLRWTLGLVLVAGVAAIAANGAAFMAIHPTDTSGRLWHQINGYVFGLIFLLLGIILLWNYLAETRVSRFGRKLVGALLILLVVAEMWQFAYKFVRIEAVGPERFWVSAKEIVGDTDSRVLPWGVDLFSQNGALQVGLYSVFGYAALEPGPHLSLVSNVPDPRSTAYDVLAVDYVVAPVPLDQFTTGDGAISLVDHRGDSWVYWRPRSMSLARLVYEVEIIADDQTAVERVNQPEFDPASTVLLGAEPPCEIGPAPAKPGTAEITMAEAGFWRIRTDSPAQALLILAESAYPGWQVTVDGQNAEALTAYTTIKSVCVPAGAHIVEWEFVPTAFMVGGAITLSFLALVAIAGGFALFKRTD